MELNLFGEVHGIRTAPPPEFGTVAIKIRGKVVRFETPDAHLWMPGLRVRVTVIPIEDEPLVVALGSIDD